MKRRPSAAVEASMKRRPSAVVEATSSALVASSIRVCSEDGLEAPSVKRPINSCGATSIVDALQEEMQYVRESLSVRKLSVLSNARVDHFNNYSVLERVPKVQKSRIVDLAKSVEALDRAMGSMCGMGVGDAMGHMFEFLDAQDRPGEGPGGSYFSLETMTFEGELFNKFRLKLGQWTDDSSMGLCMADSLLLKNRYDGSDIRIRFWCWWNCGYNNAFRLDKLRGKKESVGLGGNIATSLAEMKAGQKPPPIVKAKGEDAGNGSLMRFTPIAIYCHSASMEELYKLARQSSYTTHPGIISAEACSLLAHLIHRALHRPSGPIDTKQFIEECTAEYLVVSGLESKSGKGYREMKWLVTGKPERATERCWAWREESLDIRGTLRARGRQYNGYPVSAGYFGSYSLDGLAMAIWSVYHTTSFDTAIAKAINLLGDADSHGSITGQLAGALYGYSSIHPQFLKWQQRWDHHEFAVRAILLHELGAQAAKINKQ